IQAYPARFPQSRRQRKRRDARVLRATRAEVTLHQADRGYWKRLARVGRPARRQPSNRGKLGWGAAFANAAERQVRLKRALLPREAKRNCRGLDAVLAGRERGNVAHQ